jgi:hypothetical protein
MGSIKQTGRSIIYAPEWHQLDISKLNSFQSSCAVFTCMADSDISELCHIWSVEKQIILNWSMLRSLNNPQRAKGDHFQYRSKA